jgi:hypothetical protein
VKHASWRSELYARMFSQAMWYLGWQDKRARFIKEKNSRQRGLTTPACAAAAEGPGANGLFLEWLEDLQLVKKAVSESA